jgi:hypothetical protein
MKTTSQLLLAFGFALGGCLLYQSRVATAATPATTAEYHSSDSAVMVIPVRTYRPYGNYYRPYYRPNYAYRPYYASRPYVYGGYRPYYAPVSPYTYGYARNSYYGPYYGGRVYYGRPRYAVGFRW